MLNNMRRHGIANTWSIVIATNNCNNMSSLKTDYLQPQAITKRKNKTFAFCDDNIIANNNFGAMSLLAGAKW